MNKWNFIFVFLMFNIGFSQKEPNVDCSFFGKKTIEKRNAMFPFNRSKKVLIISYPNAESILFVDENGDNKFAVDSIGFSKRSMKIEREFKFRRSKSLPTNIYDATKIVELNKDQLNILSNWMFNYKFKIIDKNKKLEGVKDIKCYTPRNAILFIDDNQKVISVLEICFECQQYYLIPSSHKFGKAFGTECDKTLNYFKTLFLSNKFEIKN